jgi:hypothetical protein
MAAMAPLEMAFDGTRVTTSILFDDFAVLSTVILAPSFQKKTWRLQLPRGPNVMIYVASRDIPIRPNPSQSANLAETTDGFDICKTLGEAQCQYLAILKPSGSAGSHVAFDMTCSAVPPF